MFVTKAPINSISALVQIMAPTGRQAIIWTVQLILCVKVTFNELSVLLYILCLRDGYSSCR